MGSTSNAVWPRARAPLPAVIVIMLAELSQSEAQQNTQLPAGDPSLSGLARRSQASVLSSWPHLGPPALASPGHRPRGAGASPQCSFPAWRGPSLTHSCTSGHGECWAGLGSATEDHRARGERLFPGDGCLAGVNDRCPGWYQRPSCS